MNVTIPISLADLELVDEPAMDVDPITIVRLDVKTTQSTQRLPRIGTGTIANRDTWLQRIRKKLHLG